MHRCGSAVTRRPRDAVGQIRFERFDDVPIVQRTLSLTIVAEMQRPKIVAARLAFIAV
jgi:hypothetical protein